MEDGLLVVGLVISASDGAKTAAKTVARACLGLDYQWGLCPAARARLLRWAGLGLAVAGGIDPSADRASQRGTVGQGPLQAGWAV